MADGITAQQALDEAARLLRVAESEAAESESVDFDKFNRSIELAQIWLRLGLNYRGTER